MVTLKDMRYLLALAEHRHFGRAAEACFVSQPTLSGQIQKLEKQLGYSVVERNRRKLLFTAEGLALVESARKVLLAADGFEQQARALQSPLSGDLRLGSIPTLAPYFLGQSMEAITAALPGIRLYLFERKTEELLDQLGKGELDVLVLPWFDSMLAFDRINLFKEPLWLALPEQHSLTQKKHLSLKDLVGERVLTLEDGHCLRDQAMNYCFSVGADEDERFRASSLETLRYMVGNNLGITLMPSLAAKAVAPWRIRYRSFDKPEPHRQVSLVFRKHYPRMALMRALSSVIKSLELG